MMGCPGGGNEIRLKTVSIEGSDATTDCMPPTSLRLRQSLILIHSRIQVYPTCTQTPPRFEGGLLCCWRGQIYGVTNQKITTSNGNSCASQSANGALTMFQLIHISSLAFFQCANGVIADVVVLVIFTPFVVDFAADNVSGFVV